MAEYYFIMTSILKIWQSITLLYLVSHRYGKVLLCYILYPKGMAEYYFIITGIHKIWQSMTLLLFVSLRYGRVLHYYNWYP